MLKISFLVTFCGLLARMAQAQSLPCNQMPVIIPASTLSTAVAPGIPPNIIAPIPPSVNDATTGAQYANLIPMGPPNVSCTVNTQSDRSFGVTLTGVAQYKGDINGSQPAKGVGCEVTNSVITTYKVDTNAKGDITCEPSSMEEPRVTCNAKPARGGLLSGLLGVVSNLLNGLLTALTSAVQGAVKSKLPNLLESIKVSLNTFLKALTDEKPMGNNQTCKQTVTTVTTNSNNCLNIVMESTMYTQGGAATPPPAGNYIAPPITPDPDTGCKYAIPEQWINYALARTPTTQYQVTDINALALLAANIQQLCGNTGISFEKLVFIATGAPQVTITSGKVSATLTGNLQAFSTGNPSPFLTATVTLMFKATFEYKNYCLMINLEFISIATAKLPNGPSCDVTNPVSQTFTEQLQGKVTINTCAMPSPAVGLNFQGQTTITPGDGYVICDHKI